jgi:nucleotide-binding universal stress UspA family protein
VLAGGPNSRGRLSGAALGAIILGSGRPVLLAPDAETGGPIKTIAFAWKDTAEAARSLTAAMPLLNLATRVHLFCAEEGKQTTRPDRIASYENIIRYLRWHGFKADGHFVTVGIRTAAEAVLDGARSVEADLLVMGAYGRARLRELIFGGFTQEILNGTDFPVFLFH